MHKPIYLTLAIAYTIALAILSLVNVDNEPLLKLDHGDKLVHIVAYALLTLIWYISFRLIKIRSQIVWIGVLCIVYGIIIEVFQGMFSNNRVSDVLDVMANGIGVFTVVLFILLREKAKVKNR